MADIIGTAAFEEGVETFTAHGDLSGTDYTGNAEFLDDDEILTASGTVSDAVVVPAGAVQAQVSRSISTCLIHIRPLNRPRTERVDIRVADGPSADAYAIGGQNWEPAVRTRPTLSIELMSTDMDGRVQAGRAAFEIAMQQLLAVDRPDLMYWRGASVTIHNTGVLEGAGATPDFTGYITSARLDLETKALSVSAEVSTTLIDKPLLTGEFTGGGGILGDAGKRGTLWPAGFGAVRNIEPTWFDLTRNIGMIDGYGNTLSIDWLGEGLATFGPRVADYPSYAALAAAIDSKAIKAGQWGTCVAEGLVGLGAPPVGVITVHAVFGFSRIGSMMQRILLTHAKVPVVRIDFAAFAALDSMVPRPVHYWTAEQRNTKDLIEALAQSCNATPLVSFQGKVTVTRAVASGSIATLDRSGSVEPRVLDWREADQEAPYSVLKARAARPARVLTDDQVLYVDDIIDTGIYSATTVYRAGNLVWLDDGSQWLYQNETPAAGHAPPSTALPDENGDIQDPWWFRRQAPRPVNGGGGSDFLAQGSVDGINWHDGLLEGDIYLRTSTDNGNSYGPAIKIVGEEGERGEDGSYQQQIFKRSPTQPPTPTGGGIPAGWSDGVPAGTDLIWLSVQYQRNGLALGPWSLPAQIKGDKGEPGEKAPLVRTQWSVDGNSLWHDTYTDGDLYQRQSNDGGLTYGQAVRVVGESDGGSAGADGVSPSIVFRRSATIPATPAQDTGNPPPGWFDGPPAGTEILWQSTSRFRGVLQLQPWSAPVRISGAPGADGASSFTLVNVAKTIVTTSTVTKTGSTTDWDAKARTVESGAAPSVSACLDRGTFIGLTTDPTVDASYGSIDYAWHRSDDPNFGIGIYCNGVVATANLPETNEQYANSALSVIKQGEVVIFLVDGVEKYRRAPFTANERLYGVAALANPGGKVRGITFALNGADGPPGLNNATVYAYQRSASGAPPQPTGVATYTFATAALTGLTNGWSPTLPGGIDPLYIIAATASSAAATDTIAGAEWSGAVQSGANGTSGVNTKSLFIYQRASAVPPLPSQNATYTFSTAALANLTNGWTATIPGGTLPIWISTATALSPTDVDNINPGEWAAAQLLAQSGTNGTNGVDGYVVDADVSTFIIPVYSGGAAKPSWTGGRGTIRLRKGTGIITSGVSYAVEDPVNIASLSLAGAVFTFAGLTADSGSFTIVATFDGISYRAKVNVKKIYDGSAAFQSQTNFSGTTGSGSTAVPGNRLVTISAYANYSVAARPEGSQAQARMNLYYRNATDDGPLTFMGSVDGSVASTSNSGSDTEPVYSFTPGTVSASFQFTSPAADKVFEYLCLISYIVASAAVTISGAIKLEVSA